MNIVRRYRVNSNDLSNEPKSTLSLSSGNTSIFPLVRPGFLHRTENNTPPVALQEPLLSFTLSSPSFLDSTIQASSSSYPLYRIKTSGTSTAVLRRDLEKKSIIVAASIKWPKIIPLKRGKACSEAVLVMIKNGKWSGGDTLLKPGSKESSSRKFHIPNYNHPLKWKLHGTRFWCTTSAVAGPVAILDPRKGNRPPKLSVYETLHDKSSHQLSTYRGVSVLLLDYLMVTALLLVTDLQEWMLVPKLEGQASSTAAMPTVATADLRWRKIMFGEPIYPKIARSPYSSPPLQTTPCATDRFKLRSPMPRAGTPPSGNFHLKLKSFFDDSEHSEGGDETHGFPATMSSISLADDSTEHSHTEFNATFYQPPSPIQEPAVPSRPLSTSTSPLDFLQPQSPSSVSTNFDTYLSLSPIPQSPSEDRSQSQCDSPIVNLRAFDGQIFPRSLPLLPLQQPPSADERRLSLTSSARLSTMIHCPRPLPLPLAGNHTIMHKLPPVSDLRRSASVPLSLEPRPLRPLPPTPASQTPSPRDIIAVTSSGIPTQSLEGCNSHSVYPPERQPSPIRKTSHEDLAQWLHMLTTNSETRADPPRPLPRTFDVPPPAYTSLRFSVRPESVGRTPVPVWENPQSN